MELITIKTFESYLEAHILKSRLGSENIKSYIQDEHMMTINPLYNITIGGIKLKVESCDLEKSNEILRDIENTPITNDENKTVVCPKCNSGNIYADFKSTKSLKGIVSMLLSFSLMTYPIYYSRIRKCKDCSFEFKI